MENNSTKSDAILKKIQEREMEQSLFLSVSNSLVSVSEPLALTKVLKSTFKEHLLFDHFIICVTDELEEKYRVLCDDEQNSSEKRSDKYYKVNDGLFNITLSSAEAVTVNLQNFVAKKNKLPPFIEKKYQSGIREVIAFPLHCQKEQPAIIFLLYKKPPHLSRLAHRLLQALSLQLSITVSNIVITQKVAAYKSKINSNSIQTEADGDELITKTENPFSNIIGESISLQKVTKLITQVASSESTVLILGESGTGKELVAQAIHDTSAHKNKKMIKVNCAAIPENLINSELFGHEKGSFTGALERRIGKFELANNSTLFLDEIGELPLELQTKLLRVLQEKEIERIGGKKSIPVNVRIIAATNRNLELEIQKGYFRSDLFYRLNVFPIILPPLRDRKEDIIPLCKHFLEMQSKKSNKKINSISSKVIKSMMDYSWPGNIRELQHMLERSVLLTTGTIIKDIDFAQIGLKNSIDSDDFQIKTLEQIQKEHILHVIKLCNGRISGPHGAAIKLAIPATTLISKMQKLGIKKEHFIAKT